MEFLKLTDLEHVEHASDHQQVAFLRSEIETTIEDWQVDEGDYKLDDKADMEAFIENYMSFEDYNPYYLSPCAITDEPKDKFNVVFEHIETLDKFVVFKPIVTCEDVRV